MLDRTNQTVDEFGAILVGFDVEGFSRTVEKAAIRYGPGAGELAAQRILAGERIATDLAHRSGLRFADALGDGAVYLKVQGPPSARDIRSLQRFQEELKYAHLKQTGLSIRTAWTHGSVRMMRPTAPMLEHSEVLWGPAVAQLHTALSRRPLGWRAVREDRAERPDLANREGEIAEMTFVFLRLCRSAEWSLVDERILNDALGLIARWAEHLGGKLERTTQDEKGLHVRVGLPGVNTQNRDWETTLREPQSALRALGLDGAIAAAGGTVYRGPSEHGSTIVHGGPVNRAAKLCAAQPPGGLAVDSSLSANAAPAPRARDAIIGREAETDKALLWLAGSGPRLVLLWGEAGMGKSHLLRDILAQSPAATRAFIAGAPTRMLDPMGAWFELIGLGARLQRPEDNDLAWAEEAFAQAGLDIALLPLCARALRGVDTMSEITRALSGGERAARTQEGIIALIGALAHDGPVMFAIDDLHELDEPSIALTLLLLDRGLRVSILATRRPARDDGRLADLQQHLSTLEIPVPPLSASEIVALVGALGDHEVDPAEIIAISGGNPSGAVQAALALLEDGKVDGERTLAAILDRRLDRLPIDEREILRALSIADRSWRAADIDRIAPSEGRARGIEETLARLTRAKLIERTPTDAEAFKTSHRLLADLVRRRTPAGVKRQLAGRAARRLTRIGSGGVGAPAVEIARLWGEAGSRGRAAILYERAARSAALEGADSVCARLLALALALFEEDLLESRPRRVIRWLAELSRAQWSMGLVDVANLTARDAVSRARLEVLPPDLRDSAVAASAMRAETGQFLGDVREIVIGSLEAGRLGAASSERVVAQGRGLSALGYVLGLARMTGTADRILHRGEGMASGVDPRPAAFALTARAILHFIFCRWAAGEEALDRARTICVAWPQHHLMDVIETTCGIGAHLQAHGERALLHFDALASRALERGSLLHVGWADYASAQTLLALDRAHEGWARLMSAEDRLRGLTDRQSTHICQGLRARLAWHLGEIDEALSAAIQCGDTSRALPPTNYSSTEAYSAPALVGALVLATGGTIGQRQIARSLVRRHLGDLERYALVFPIARPRLAIVKAVIGASKRRARTLARLEAAAERADGKGLGFEASLARQIHADVADRL